jgi:hypothetical protein
MSNLTRLGRIVQLATLPETRGVIVGAMRSDVPRDLAWRAAHDRTALLREAADPATGRAVARTAIRHPATRELANAGLMVLPLRYLPVGWAASWATSKVLARYFTPSSEVLEASVRPSPKHVGRGSRWPKRRSPR